MLATFEYLVKMIALSGVMATYYALLLKNRPFHRYNRFYLLFAVAISIVLPLVDIPEWNTNNFGNATLYVETLQTVTISPVKEAVTGLRADYSLLILCAYALISLIRLRSDVLSINKIKKLKQEHVFIPIEHIKLYKINEPGTPFTFLNSVFWNPEVALESKRGQQLLRHESVHALQKHTYDILFIRAAMVFAWINPFFYFFYKELVMTHEFIADDLAADVSGKTGYAECLVSTAIDRKNFSAFANHFYYSPLKRRIDMLLHKFNRDRFSLIRRLLVIPVIILAFAALSVRAQTSQAARAKPSAKPSPQVSAKSSSSASAASSAHSARVSNNSDDKEASFPGGFEAWQAYLIKTIHYPIEAQDKEIKGTVVVQFKVAADGTTTGIKAIYGPKAGGLREEAVRVIKESGKWLPATKNGKPVASTKKQPIQFVLERQ